GVPLRRTVSSASYLSQDSRHVHIGLGPATKVDRMEVRWLRGAKETWTNLAAGQIWEITQGDPQARAFRSAGEAAPPGSQAAPALLDRAALVQFWAKQHAAMDAMKRERNFTRAAELFREALAINPQHEDSHYYLANCLATLGDVTGAIAELDVLARINPQNHRAFQRKGELLAASASSRSQLEDARQSLDTALKLNSEETGTLILRGQVSLAEQNFADAERDLAHACQANPRAANAWFLRAYVAWKKHDNRAASAMLNSVRNARGRDWKPAGSALEGDVQRRMYSEAGFLTIFEQLWDGTPDQARAFSPLDSYLRRFRQ
ncbi:MAG TPA: tetratricopeptide repeat protein, partial [Terriglobales bacterium]|nr:tetratricopeptide repeat protein [Terriglobales bacterium]